MDIIADMIQYMFLNINSSYLRCHKKHLRTVYPEEVRGEKQKGLSKKAENEKKRVPFLKEN